ncbi:MAG: TraR/DksA C4-type zinc finger protein [Steroidobacteraceae bacterium]
MPLETIRRRLIARRDELAQRAAGAESDLRREREPLSADFSEQVTQRENDDVLKGISEAARSELSRINQALARLDSGQYTTCAACGGPIEHGRLEAVPYTDRCAPCARGERPGRGGAS